jgi:hypothetical protein
VAEDERLQELSGRVEDRRAAIQQLREALRGARAHNEELEGAIEEVTIEKRFSKEHRAGKATCLPG